MMILRWQKGPKRESKWSQKRSKIEAEIEDEKCSSLGPSLGRFGVALVSISGSKIIKNHWFFIRFREKSCFLNIYSLKMHFGSILDRFWLPNGAQMAPKMVPKCNPKSIKKRIDFWIGFWSSPEAVITIDTCARGATSGGGTPRAKAKS